MEKRNANDCRTNKSKRSVNGRSTFNAHRRIQRKRRHINDADISGNHIDTKKYKSRDSKTQSSGDLWFDGVDECLITASKSDDYAKSTDNAAKLVKSNSFNGMTRIVAMDCEMVGTGDGGRDSILARVSIVNYFGNCIYDKFVKPTDEVTDYRTAVSGIRPANLINAEEFKTVQKEVSDIMKGRVLVGHSIRNDLEVLYLSHPHHQIRDTQKYFKRMFGNRPSLKRLAEALLHINVQSGEHDSVEDARVAMRLYTMHRIKWESKMRGKKSYKKQKKSKK